VTPFMGSVSFYDLTNDSFWSLDPGESAGLPTPFPLLFILVISCSPR
jgi:hypothetical protein